MREFVYLAVVLDAFSHRLPLRQRLGGELHDLEVRRGPP